MIDWKKIDKKLLLRALFFIGILLAFYSAGVGIEALEILALLFAAILILRDRVWKASERALEKYFPAAKKLPDWGEKIILVIIFLAIYLVMKSALYFVLGLFGIDVEKILIDAFTKAFANA